MPTIAITATTDLSNFLNWPLCRLSPVIKSLGWSEADAEAVDARALRRESMSIWRLFSWAIAIVPVREDAQRKSTARSFADWYRSPGFFSRHLTIMSSKRGEMAVFIPRGGFGDSWRMASTIAVVSLCSKGTWPVDISY